MSEQPAESAESGAATTTAIPAKQALLLRQRELESELAHARQAAGRARRGAARSDTLAVEPEEESWLMTYLDMMTLMLVLLVVMLAFAGKGGGLEGMKQMAGGMLSARDGVLPATDGLLPDSALQVPTPLPQKPVTDPLEGLKLDQLGDDIDVVVNESTVSFRISSEILFSSGQADLSLAGLAVLKRLVPVLNSTDHVIAVVGHTDSVPVRSGRYPSNWELSGSRAGGVVRYLEANGVASKRLRAVGYADTRPLADNATAEGRASNRRVELIMETPGS
ncbi:chemotaxis protein MotB [Geopseudomonas sagittaria]|uniref:Chemotaxis protein MotB n=1 Tax=Geopseudomonas sagittaria TaxID=1135990 RepID=A0A1I5QHF1_9GAMM|nr:OmpA family protein [Pseudomonas sagittaria]MCM2318405.1 OmpA family protein [Pseudomonas sp.]SFP45306.1 chemotaxis protein MotB [Pseudomonas sagittaria]